ncbi:MAG: PAAR domain-containing protein [Bdellovibrionales bacterium]
MGNPAAKQNDQVTGTDTHLLPNGSTAPFPFVGFISGGLSSDVNIQGFPAATKDSEAQNTTAHMSGTSPASNKGTVVQGSTSVFINGKPAARSGDQVKTCNDPADLPTSTVIAVSTVFIGG